MVPGFKRAGADGGRCQRADFEVPGGRFKPAPVVSFEVPAYRFQTAKCGRLRGSRRQASRFTVVIFEAPGDGGRFPVPRAAGVHGRGNRAVNCYHGRTAGFPVQWRTLATMRGNSAVSGLASAVALPSAESATVRATGRETAPADRFDFGEPALEPLLHQFTGLLEQ